ncbi:hypothetical protein GALMADRAFT_247963 [Galerina marginata CBS 339.88]|uniref:J domain-containing protein n=1 Tax=Galerina marginata (strain CBS 339.88) TaxID=685588 RepID=A0A067T6I8_GALM3|nr:hypothetical protein GALMADRAFT_247963 [Galerina marginata CBS 339.88]
MGSTNLLVSLFGWTFVPDFATKHLLNFIYHKSPIRIVAVPQPGSLQHRKHYAVTFAVVIFTYLTYTLVQSARAMPPNFYQILGVPPTVDENGLKLAFRAFAKRYHPDRPGVGREGEEMFMYVRDAFEALKDPVVRFAYDRFGPDVVGWRQHCKTTRDFLRQGLMVSSGYHIVAGIALLFWSAIGRPSAVSFWRYVLFAALFAGELSFILSPFPAASSNLTPPTSSFFSFLPSFSVPSPTDALSLSSIFPTTSFLQTIFPNRIPYQHILFLHQLFMFLSVALSRVVPQFIFLLSQDGNPDSKQLDAVERAIWERIYGTLAIADREASVILHTILHSISPSSSPSSTQPYHDPTLARMFPLSPAQTTEALEKLTPEMRHLVIEANIKNQTAGPIASAWDAALRRAREISLITHPSGGSTTMSSNAGNSTSPATTNTTPITPRTKNFWEKDAGEEEAVAFVDDVPAAVPVPVSATAPSSSSRPGSPHKLSRTPSTPRMGRREKGDGDGSSSPTKAHSPVRRTSFGVGAGEF